ncbi:putative voltage-gated potassium channel subunit beta [Nymphon striatum]|nr:putative voltage-gated potassium channel subunit beta [Nymphon striatum]
MRAVRGPRRDGVAFGLARRNRDAGEPDRLARNRDVDRFVVERFGQLSAGCSSMMPTEGRTPNRIWGASLRSSPTPVLTYTTKLSTSPMPPAAISRGTSESVIGGPSTSVFNGRSNTAPGRWLTNNVNASVGVPSAAMVSSLAGLSATAMPAMRMGWPATVASITPLSRNVAPAASLMERSRGAWSLSPDTTTTSPTASTSIRICFDQRIDGVVLVFSDVGGFVRRRCGVSPCARGAFDSRMVSTGSMEHRRLGKSGIKVSVLSFGSWVTFGDQLDIDKATECIQAAWDAGVTFFDNAEAYAGGKSETIMGEVFRRMGLDRRTYTVSTKLYWGIDGSLERLGLDHVDMLFCHRADPETPMDERTTGAPPSGPGAEYKEACAVAERLRLRPPVMEQPQYNMFERDKVENDYADIYDAQGMGLTTWSPLASGLLTGKYNDGIPEGSRGSLPSYSWLQDRLTDEAALTTVRNLQSVADELGASMAQLAIAWCAANPRVSTVITGASRVEQIHHNMEAADLIASLTPDVMGRIEEILS